MKDYGIIFEEVTNFFIKKPSYVTYATYWDVKNERVALLYTACLLAYDKSSSDLKLERFLSSIFKDNDKKEISIDCLKYLHELKNLTYV